MRLVHYGTDGDITVNDHTYRFCDFLKLEPRYSAPHGFHTRVYERGVKHYITDGHNLLYLPSTDAECDRICNREGELARLVVMLRAEE
jgi:hypothetical protein